MILCSRSYSNQYLSSILAGIAVLCVGCTVGWTSPALKKLKGKDSPIFITEEESSWIAASHEIGHFLSPIPTGLLLAKFGRKRWLLFSSVLILIGWIIVYFSTTVFTLYIARCLFGSAMGIVFTVVPLYIAEIASPEIRGALSTFFQSMLYLGHVIEFSIGPYVSFQVLNGISLAIAFVSFILLFFMVESPLFLISIGQRDRASSVLKWLFKSEHTGESEVVKLDQMLENQSSNSSKFKLLFTKAYFSKLLVVVFTAVAQRFTGMSAFVAYASSTFASADGLTSDEYTILFGVLVFLFTFVSAVLIDSLGRRPLLLFSCLGCALTHLVSGTYYYGNFVEFPMLPFLMITLFSIVYSLGLGPLINTLQGELFPPNLKGVASSIVTVSHAASSFAVTKLFQVIKSKVGIFLNFYIFAISCIISFIISYLIVPETKRLELEVLQRPTEERQQEEN
ncbi:facilitated trehalose transporter Tret1 [Halyomorpha halys]|uniref:facilitated trehalose transporter Tret1 n=1 Tax=Halyomorpha halys TaxID=286706 RepID=UPI0006D51BE9|nr:facilitated trehalose transporter Tret1-like [Halyomorpha halys]